MIEVRLNFKSVEEAIVALARMNGDDVKAKKAAPPVLQSPNKDVAASQPSIAGGSAAPSQEDVGRGAVASVVTPDPTKRPRKPRSDAGQERGPYKPRAQDATAASNTPVQGETGSNATTAVTDPAEAGAQPVKPKSTPADAPGGSPAASTSTNAVVATEADAQAALEGIFRGKGLPAAQKVLADFGISRLRDLPAEKRAGFIAAAKVAAVAG